MIQQKTPKKIKGERKKRAAERKALQAKAAEIQKRESEIQKRESEIENAAVLKIGDKYFIKKSALWPLKADDVEGSKRAFEILAELEAYGIKEFELVDGRQWDILAHGEKSPYYKKEKGDNSDV